MRATKENTIKTISNALNGDKQFIHTDGIQYDLDGAGMAEWLNDCGYNVVNNTDVGRNGLVVLSNGIRVSTNGYCYA